MIWMFALGLRYGSGVVIAGKKVKESLQAHRSIADMLGVLVLAWDELPQGRFTLVHGLVSRSASTPHMQETSMMPHLHSEMSLEHLLQE